MNIYNYSVILYKLRYKLYKRLFKQKKNKNV